MATKDSGRGRRQYGTGTVFQRSDGRWIGRYRDGHTRSGRERYRTVSDMDEKRCRAKLNAAIRDARKRDKDAGVNPRATVKDWCEEWLTIRVEQVRPKTYSTDASAVKQWIIPTLGGKRLADLTPADLRALDAAGRKAGKAQSTIKRTRDVLVLALKAATVEGYDVPSRIFMVDSPERGVTDRTALPVVDAVRLLRASEEMPDRSRWVAALLQGMRQAECLGLTWDRVDLDAGLVDVSWQAQELTSLHGCPDDKRCGKRRASDCPARRFRVPPGYEARQITGRWHWTRPKTKAGRRLSPLVPWMVAALRAWKEVAPPSPHGLVWPAPDGRPRLPGDDLAAFRALQDAAADPDSDVPEHRLPVRHPAGRRYTLHECRHTTATLLMALGVDTQVIIALMGHSSILSTRTYQHADLQLMRTALEGVAERLQLTA